MTQDENGIKCTYATLSVVLILNPSPPLKAVLVSVYPERVAEDNAYCSHVYYCASYFLLSPDCSYAQGIIEHLRQ